MITNPETEAKKIIDDLEKLFQQLEPLDRYTCQVFETIIEEKLRRVKDKDSREENSSLGKYLLAVISFMEFYLEFLKVSDERDFELPSSRRR